MEITKVEAVSKTRWLVELDGSVTFALYKGEISRFGIQEGQELPEETYRQICREVLLKRAKLRALHLLEDSPRTEAGLREKLRQGMYPEDIVEQALDYVKSFGYLDDSKYAENYILSHRNTKSRTEMYAALYRRGVQAQQIDGAFERCYEEDGEETAIRRIIQKRGITPSSATEQERNRLYGYLARKGFCYESVRRVMQNWELS